MSKGWLQYLVKCFGKTVLKKLAKSSIQTVEILSFLQGVLQI